MNFWNTINVGLKEIWAHKFRSLLTMLGIILGVASLVAMSAMVKGMEEGLREALVAMGGLEKVRVEQVEELPIYQRHRVEDAVGMTLKDVYALQHSAPLLESINPTVELFGYRDRTFITYQGKAARPFIFAGTWPNALALNDHRVEHGRMYNEIDDETARNVCVIGTGIRDELFGSPEQTGEEIIPVGETVNINSQPFTIIGMFEHYESEEARRERELRKKDPLPTESGPKRSRGWRGGSHFIFRLKNNTVYIPLNTMMMKFRAVTGTNNVPDARLTTINIKVPRVELLMPGLQQARNVLMTTHQGVEDFTFRTQEEEAEQITTVIRNARMSGSIIAAISLIVGGIGIMNIMLASISERIREIGIRKAVGATTAGVFVQILIEGVVIALLGGLAGLAVSYGLVLSIASFTPSDNTPIITAGAMLFAFSCSAAIGVAAGLFPAIKASRLHPIQALRYD